LTDKIDALLIRNPVKVSANLQHVQHKWHFTTYPT